MIKSCSKCKQEKPLELFAVYNGKPWCWCKPCQRAASRDYYNRHPEKRIAEAKKYRERNPERVRERMREYREKNKEILNQKTRERRLKYLAENPMWDKNRNLKKTYRIDLAEYNAMLLAQGGVCAICKKPSQAGKMLSVDHCHHTGAVRGLLCIKCNFGIGSLEDNISLVEEAARYLRKFSGVG